MKEQNNVNLPESLEQLPTPQLDAMLRAELKKDFPDEHAVRLILKVLREREADFPVVSNKGIEKAWGKYQKETAKATASFKWPMIKAAAILILVSLLLFSLPQEAQAEGFFSRIATWTESVFALFNQWNQSQTPKEYVFQTDHPGLQELYDAVTELGVTAPVVPMWLNDEYELDFLNISISPLTTKVLVEFVDNEKEAVFELNIYSDNIPREFHKNETNVGTHESNGIIHYIFRNNELWTVVWTRDNLECSIYIECQEDVLYKILDSIYEMEE